jgi:hypothetical protein
MALSQPNVRDGLGDVTRLAKALLPFLSLASSVWWDAAQWPSNLITMLPKLPPITLLFIRCTAEPLDSSGDAEAGQITQK